MLFREAIEGSRWLETLAWTILCLFLLLCLPLFLCLPPWADVTLYDLAARSVLRGGVLYREIFDTNLPGMVWLHLAIRTLFGWRSETLRAVDFLVVAGIVGLLVWGWRRADCARSLPVWTALALFAFYLSTAESSHCQRDVWMLLPALGALHLRGRQVSRLSGPCPSAGPLWVGALAEGLCWAAACWIKPHVAAPALACWVVSIVCVCRGPAWRARGLAVDAIGLLAGGLLVGGCGVAWLWHSGAWPHFCEVFLDWNREYYAQSTGFVQHTRDLFKRFRPWSQIHYLALPLAVVSLGRMAAPPFTRRLFHECISLMATLRARSARSGYGRASPALWARDFAATADDLAKRMSSWAVPITYRRALLAGLYLAWLVQAAYFQKGHDYVLVPPVLLALTLVADQLALVVRKPWAGVVLAGWAVYVGVHHPLLQPQRLAVWGRCWREHSTAAIRDRLKLTTVPFTVHWVALEQVADYLRCQGVRDGEVVCYNNFTHPLYLDLDLRPATPFLHFDTILTAFPRHREVIRQRLGGERRRFVVSDLDAVRVQGPLVEGSDGSLALPPEFPPECAQLFPWTEPILFRAGSYLVHQVTGPAGALVPETCSAGRRTFSPR